jgi:hypothetical protein
MVDIELSFLMVIKLTIDKIEEHKIKGKNIFPVYVNTYHSSDL